MFRAIRSGAFRAVRSKWLPQFLPLAASLILLGCESSSIQGAFPSPDPQPIAPRNDSAGATAAFDSQSTAHGELGSSRSNIGSSSAFPLKATNPSPASGTASVTVGTTLRWTPGVGATLHFVYLGTSAAAVRTANQLSPEYRGRFSDPIFVPDLSPNLTYYWRVDENNGADEAVGDVWQFSTSSLPGIASNFWPLSGAVHVPAPLVLTWTPGAGATSHNLYLGASFAGVLTATPTSPTFMGNRTLPNYLAASLSQQTTYYWRVDEVGPGGISRGPMLSFVTRPPALTAPIISPEYEVTDRSLGQTVGNSPNPECSNFTRIDNSLYFLYRCATPLGLYLRRFDLSSNSFAPSVLVDALTDPAYNGYHSEPTLLRNAAGGLHVLNQYAPTITQCRGSFGSAPRHRIVPDITKPSSWSTPDCFPSRVATLYSSQFYDAMGAYDNRAGITHCVGQSYGFAGLDGQPNDGFPRTYYRINSQGSVDGPYVIVEAATGNIPEIPYSVAGASIFAKGDLVLGREASGQRTLHVVWNIRAQWTDGPTTRQCNVNLYYARSTDGGNTWTNAANTASVPLLQHIKLNDSRFLAYAGEVDQDSERAFDVDSRGRPFMVFKKYRSGTGVIVGNHVDVLATPPPQYDLYWTRWSGTGWSTSALNTTANWANERPKVRLDLDDKIYVFLGDRPSYYVSSNGGFSWTGPVIFGTKYCASRIFSAPDPLDPNFHLLAYTDRDTLGLYFVRIQLTNP